MNLLSRIIFSRPLLTGLFFALSLSIACNEGPGKIDPANQKKFITGRYNGVMVDKYENLGPESIYDSMGNYIGDTLLLTKDSTTQTIWVQFDSVHPDTMLFTAENDWAWAPHKIAFQESGIYELGFTYYSYHDWLRITFSAGGDSVWIQEYGADAGPEGYYINDEQFLGKR